MQVPPKSNYTQLSSNMQLISNNHLLYHESNRVAQSDILLLGGPGRSPKDVSLFFFTFMFNVRVQQQQYSAWFLASELPGKLPMY